MKEQAWLVLRQHGMLIEEAINDGREKFENYATYAEKVAVQSGLASDIFSGVHSTKDI
jgi:hypothetical protein